MLRIALLVAGALLALILVDRVLLRLEAKGWLNYRRNGFSRGGAAYHTLQLSSIFDPSLKPTIEVRYEEQRDEEDCGAPPVDPDSDAGARGTQQDG